MEARTDEKLTHHREQGFTLQIDLPELIADIRASASLTSRLIAKGYELLDGIDVWSHDDLNILERMMIRGAREVRLCEFNRLLDDIQAFSRDFHDKAEKAATILMDFGEVVPAPLRSLDGVVVDADTSTTNHDWPGNLQSAINYLIEYLQDIDRMRGEYWVALERISYHA